MRTRARSFRFVFLVVAALVPLSGTVLRAERGRTESQQRPFTTDFRLEDCTFSSNSGANPFFSLEPGHRLILEGEEVDIYEGGVIVGHGGAWRAGVNGALPGLIMPGSFLLGSRYFQEIAPGVALDRGENLAMGLTVEVPAGTFRDCVSVLETSALSSGKGIKTYAPGVGLVIDESLRLVSWTP